MKRLSRHQSNHPPNYCLLGAKDDSVEEASKQEAALTTACKKGDNTINKSIHLLNYANRFMKQKQSREHDMGFNLLYFFLLPSIQDFAYSNHVSSTLECTSD